MKELIWKSWNYSFENPERTHMRILKGFLWVSYSDFDKNPGIILISILDHFLFWNDSDYNPGMILMRIRHCFWWNSGSILMRIMEGFWWKSWTVPADNTGRFLMKILEGFSQESCKHSDGNSERISLRILISDLRTLQICWWESWNVSDE